MAGGLADLIAGTPGLNSSADASQFNAWAPQPATPAPVAAPQAAAPLPYYLNYMTGNAATDSANNPYFTDPFGAPVEQFMSQFLQTPPQQNPAAGLQGRSIADNGILQNQGTGTPIGSIPFDPNSLAALMAGPPSLNSSAPASQFNVPGVTV